MASLAIQRVELECELREFSRENRGLFESNSRQGVLTGVCASSKPKPRSLNRIQTKCNWVNRALRKHLKTRCFENGPCRACVNSRSHFLATVSFGGLVGTQTPKIQLTASGRRTKPHQGLDLDPGAPSRPIAAVQALSHDAFQPLPAGTPNRMLPSLIPRLACASSSFKLRINLVRSPSQVG